MGASSSLQLGAMRRPSLLDQQRRGSAASQGSDRGASSLFPAKPLDDEIDIFANVGPSKALVQARFQKQRYEKKAAKLAQLIDIFRPKSADYGSGMNALGCGVRRSTDSPHRSKINNK